MGFSDISTSDIRAIVIGEHGEYGRRLVRYLENHLTLSMRVYQFTTIESFLSFEGNVGIYLLEESFFEELPQEWRENCFEEKLILLTSQEEEGAFCKYHSPEELLCEIMERLFEDRTAGQQKQELRRQVRITMVYSPVYEENLQGIARTFMKPGDLYLGAEDLGYMPDSLDSQRGGDMGDLCYYIHLREEKVLDILEGMIMEEGGISFLPSPDMYFYLRELTGQDYEWFFEKIKREGKYGEVFWGAGNGFVGNLEVMQYFNRVILVDSRDNPRQNYFCDRLESVMSTGEYRPDIWKRIYREEVSDGAI